MATRKDYKAIAKIIKYEYIRFDNRGENDYEGKHAVICITQNICNYYAQIDEWFNRDTFLRECGIVD